MHIDLVPLANGLIQTGVAVAAVLVPPLLGIGIKWALNKAGLANAQTQAVLGAEANKVFDLAVSFAEGQGKIDVDKYLDLVNEPDTKLARAASYAIAHIPDTLKKLGVDVSTPEGQQTIVRAITARVGSVTATPGR